MSNLHDPYPDALAADDAAQQFHGRLPLASPFPSAELPSGPYCDTVEHLWDELRRIDQLVRAQTVRWWLTIGSAKPQHLWGMVHVTDAEIESYLRAPFLPPDTIPDELRETLSGYWYVADVLAQAIADRRAETPPSVMLRLDQLQSLFSLSELERDILLVCLLPELDPRYRRLYAYLQDDASRPYPSVELVLQILVPLAASSGERRAAFEAGAPLLARHLVTVGAPHQQAEPLSGRAIRVDNRIVGYLLGRDECDARLNGIVSEPALSAAWDDLLVDQEQRTRLQTLSTWWRQQAELPAGATLFLHGEYGSGRLSAAQAFCTAAEAPLLAADVSSGLRSTEGWEKIVDLVFREARLRQAAVYWAGCEQLLAPEQPSYLWAYLVAAAERHSGLTFLASHIAWDPASRFHDRPFLRLDFPTPVYELRRQVWETYLPPSNVFAKPAPDRDALIEMLANSFQFTPGQIADAVSTARSLAALRDPMRPRLSVDDLYAGCRRQSGQKLVSMARRIEPRTTLTFEDLVLPAASRRQLEELRNRIRHRSQVYSGLGLEQRLSLGQGLIALFTGSSGTGKTMSAELLAREQGVDLYKVDLSAVVSKYVGETEKNLSRVFAEAEDANAIIFFDEADALFGKRGEVKEARDRWANIEVNYLLQRVEEYAGTVILTSNLRQNIDEAFLRRIHVIVEFPFPDAEARLRILQGMFPPGIERPADAELRELAERFQLPGGSWKNIVIDAAFRALAATPPDRTPAITLRHLVAATGREYQKLGKPLTKGEFRGEYYAWVMEDILLI